MVFLEKNGQNDAIEVNIFKNIMKSLLEVQTLITVNLDVDKYNSFFVSHVKGKNQRYEF